MVLNRLSMISTKQLDQQQQQQQRPLHVTIMNIAAAPLHRLRLSGLLQSGFLLALLPSFVADALAGPGRRRAAHKLHATSYLDGLRGIAAFCVFAYHYTDYNWKEMLHAHGTNPPEQLGSSIIQLPLLRAFYNGTPMVHLFFVISGFALAFRPLSCLYNDQGGPRAAAAARCHALLASATFRRPIRLLGPPIVQTFVVMVLVRLRLLRFQAPRATLRLQLSHWLFDAFDKVIYAWGWDYASPKSSYNPHLWTIPIEFAHSLLLFLVILAVSRLRTPVARHVVMLMLMAYALCISWRWATFEFVAGALLADLHLKRDRQSAAPPPQLPRHHRVVENGGDSAAAAEKSDDDDSAPTTLHQALSAAFTTALIIACLAVFSWPQRGGDRTFHAALHAHPPPRYLEKDGRFRQAAWYALTSLALVWALGRSPAARRHVLETSWAQYLGRVSFALYVVQHAVLNMWQGVVVGSEHRPYVPATTAADEQGGGGGGRAKAARPEVLAHGLKGWIGAETPAQRTVGWVLGLVVLGAALVWASDVFWRAVDVPFVRLARRVEGMVFAREDEDDGPEGARGGQGRP